jgi:glycosyltransferase involved in cell wall biosynthesis
MAASADALVLLEETTAEAAGNATGKLFEYVGMRKPVVATARPGGAIDRVLRRTGLGRASTTAGGLADELRRIAKGGGVAPVEEAIRALSWQSIAGRLAGELDRLTGGAGAG